MLYQVDLELDVVKSVRELELVPQIAHELGKLVVPPREVAALQQPQSQQDGLRRRVDGAEEREEVRLRGRDGGMEGAASKVAWPVLMAP